MLDRLKQIPQRLLDIWKSWSRTQKTVIVSSAAVVVIVIVILAIVLSRPNYQTLTTCSDYSEMNEVTTLLTSNNISYKVDDGSLVVKVPKADLTTAKMAIASADIQSDGYTFEDAMNSSFTTTESDKTKKYAQYLASKFATDLKEINGVKDASVTVEIADDSNSFYTTTSESSVSVVLTTTKTLSDDVAESMANFLATAVGNSTTNSITIIDSNGNTLFNGASAANSTSGTSYSNQLKYKSLIESNVKSNIKQAVLATGLYDDVQLILNLSLNWDAVNTIATEYKADENLEQGLFSTSYDEVSTGTDGASGTPGTTSNGSDDTTYTVSDGTSSTSSYEVHNYSYLPNSYVTTTISEPGKIVYADSSLTVTLIKNVIYEESAAKSAGLLDGTTWDQFKQDNANPIALTVDDNWTNALAMGTGIDAANITILAYQRNYFQDKASVNVFSTVSFWLQIALAAAILGLLIFIIIRSTRPLTVEETEPELSVEEMLATTQAKQPSVDDIDLQEKSETRRAIEKFVDENPEAVALLLRNWLNED